jgi:hypothetical protein
MSRMEKPETRADELDADVRRRIEERTEQLLNEDPRERSARTQRLLAERIAYHEVMRELEARQGDA